jgi:hypothetical protein
LALGPLFVWFTSGLILRPERSIRQGFNHVDHNPGAHLVQGVGLNRHDQ